MSRFDTLVAIDKLRYADASRTQKRRLPGSCPTLLNTAPNQGEGERIRRGYAAYTDITPPTGLQKFFILPVQSPTQEDVFLWMTTTGVFQNPYWMGGGTKVSSNIQINESKTFTGAAGSVAPHTLTITGSDALTLSQTANYYKGWVLANTTSNPDEYALVTGYTYSAAASGTSVFTVVEDIYSTGINWAATDAYILYRNFHSNLTFAPTYNTGYTSPPFAISDVSRLYFSGGLSSATGNNAIISEYLNRTFFPSDTLNTFTFTGTHVTEERLKAPGSTLVNLIANGNFGRSGLQTDKTYWLAFAYVYDDFQIGELVKYETLSSYPTAGAWTRNYLASSSVTNSVASIAVTAGGSGYVTAGVAFSGGGGSGATATANVSSGAVVSVSVTNGGTGYTSAPTIAFTSGVSSVTVVGGGTGYTTGQIVTFSGGGGSGATGTVVASGGVITSITMQGYGSGYTSAPTPAVQGGGSGANLTAVIGSGATATASLSTATDSSEAISVQLTLSAATLDKRVTGVLMFAAMDSGQTVVRENQYQFIYHIPITSALGLGSSWVLNSPTGVFATNTTAIILDGISWDARGSTYIDATGMEETPADTSYSYSSRLVLNDKHFLSNVYVSSEAVANREEVFTNPRGGLAGVNAGLNQWSLFPNDAGFYRTKVELAIGTKINCMAKVGMGELLTIKDRGLILNRVIENEVDGTVQFVSQILDQNIGCSTLNGFTQLDADEGGLIFFAGYDDIYLYDNSRFQRLIERGDQQDWLYQYREVISRSSKESIVMTYFPEGVLLMDINPTGYTTGQQFQLYTQFIPDGWRQVRFNQLSGLSAPRTWFTQFGKLQNGIVLGLGTDSVATLTMYQFVNTSTFAYYYADAGTSIKHSIFTGDLVTSGDMSRDTWLDRFQIGRYFDSATQGTLDCVIYKDGSVLRTLSGMDKTSQYLKAAVMSDDPKIGNTWGIWINTNSSPEVLNAGSDFRILGIRLFGHSKPRQRVSDGGYTSGTIPPKGNTVSGVREVILNRAPQTFTWDNAFTETYTSPTEGAGIPSYSIEEAQTPYVVSSDRSQRPTVVISARTLTTWTAYSSEDNTLYRFNTIGQ